LPWAGAASNRPEMIIGVNQNTFYSAAQSTRRREGPARARDVNQCARKSAPRTKPRCGSSSAGGDLLPLTGMHARTCCSARVHGCHFNKEPHGQCGGERCAYDQQQISAPGRLGRYGGGSSTIKVIDLVRIHQLHRICISTPLRMRSMYVAFADPVGSQAAQARLARPI
jgi:hypothetical protein